jgi:hypothetical protein
VQLEQEGQQQDAAGQMNQQAGELEGYGRERILPGCIQCQAEHRQRAPGGAGVAAEDGIAPGAGAAGVQAGQSSIGSYGRAIIEQEVVARKSGVEQGNGDEDQRQPALDDVHYGAGKCISMVPAG